MYYNCRVDTIGDSCSEVAKCGMGTCEDVGFVDVPFTALCIVSLTELQEVSDTFSVPNGCCCQ